MAMTDAIPQYSPLQMAGTDRTVYRFRLHCVTSLSTSDTTFITPTSSGDLYLLDVNGSRRMHFYDAQIADFVGVLRADYDEAITGDWSFSPGSTRAPFSLGSNAYDQKVPRLNSDLLDGYHADQAVTNNTVAVRQADGRLKASDPTESDDLATKSYVDTASQGFKGRGEVRVMLTGNFACTRSGNVLTATSNGSINSGGLTDGVTDLAAGEYVLLTQQTNGEQNGKYSITTVGDGSTATVLTRTSDMDSTPTEVQNGISVLVNEGSDGAGSSWALATTGTITLNTTVLDWQAYSRGAVYLPGNGMVKSGLTFHAITSSAYTQGGFVYASSTSALSMSSAISGLVYGAGTSGPAAVTGMTTNAIQRAKGSAPYLQDSCLTDDSSILTTSRAFRPSANGTLDLGSSSYTWKDIFAADLYTSADTGSSFVPHVMLKATASSTLASKWGIGLKTATSSSNAGANLVLERYDDSGADLGAALTIIRSSGDLGLGVEAPSARLHIVKTSEQLRLGHDATYYAACTVSSAGALTIAPSGGSGTLTGGWTVARTGLNGGGAQAVLDVSSDAKTANDAITANVYGQNSSSASVVYSRASTKIISPTASSESAEWQLWLRSAGALGQVLTVNSSGSLGVGSTAPAGVLDLGSASAGRSLVWGGSGGANLYASIGTSYSSSALNALVFLKLDTTADQYLVSYTGTLAHSGIRVQGGDFRFFTEAATSRTAGDVFDYSAATKLILTSAGRLGLGTASPSALAHFVASTEQLRLGCDASNYVAATVGSTGTLSLSFSGTTRVFVGATGNFVVGSTTEHSKLGVVTNSLGTTQTATSGLALVNETAAAAGAQQISPALRLRGYGWKTDATAASQSVDFRLHVVPVQGASAPTGYLTVQAAINAGTYSELFRIGSTALTANSALIAGTNSQLTSVAVVSGSTYKWLAQKDSAAPDFVDLYGTAATWTAAQTFQDAKLVLRAGTASASGAPLKFTSGTNLTSAEEGAVEYDGTQLYLTRTRSSTARRASFAFAKVFTVGDGSSTSFTLNHYLATQTLIPVCVRASDNQVVGGPKVVTTSSDSVTVTFSGAPTSNQFRILLIGCEG